MSCPIRKYPLSQPPNYKPAIPRLQLALGDELASVQTAYVGIQRHSNGKQLYEAFQSLIIFIQNWLSDKEISSPLAYEWTELIDGSDISGAFIWICYWKDHSSLERSLQKLDIAGYWSSLDPLSRTSIGIWTEVFSTQRSRLETVYSKDDYLPGLASLPGAVVAQHNMTGYWGAARDRIPDASIDLFPVDDDVSFGPLSTTPDSKGKHLTGSSHQNLAHIRSGQFWEWCDAEEREAYETKLEPALREGLSYLWNEPEKSHAMGLRFLRNRNTLISKADEIIEDGDSVKRRETSVAGFFTDLASMEAWAQSHPSHDAIWQGAMNHNKNFPGEQKKFRTWHEVSVLKAGEARFEYVNCMPETGLIRFIQLEEKSLLC